MNAPDAAAAVETVEAVIRRRRTEKVLGDVASPADIPAGAAERNRGAVLRAVEAAGWAPFHYARNAGGLAEPWRAYVLWHDQAAALARVMRDELGATSKEPNLAAGCGALVLVTWLPEFYDPAAQAASSIPRDKQVQRDEEHLAAASAMVQNLLLLLTAHGMGTYWSSGGTLRGPEVAQRLGIPAGERMLAAVFVDYAETTNPAGSRKPGAHRDSRSTDWIREVSLP
ncbi:MAG: nitroreductase family protein [Planctomycetota bacterium]